MDGLLSDSVKAFLAESGLSHDLGRQVCDVLQQGSTRGTHVPLPALRECRTGPVAAALGRGGGAELVVCGGHNRGDGRLATAEILRRDAHAWEPLPEMACRRFLAGGGAVSEGGRTFVAVAGGDDGQRYLSSAEVLAKGEEGGEWAWTSLPDMPEPRRGPGTACLEDGSLVLAGGHDGVEDSGTCSRLTLEEGGRWSAVPSLPAHVFCPAAAQLDGLVYCCGGFDGGEFRRDVWRWDPRAPAWEPVRGMREPRAGAAMAAYGGRLRLFGGQREDFVTSTESYCPVANRWGTGTALPHALNGACAVPFGDGVALIGGSVQERPGASEGPVATCSLVL